MQDPSGVYIHPSGADHNLNEYINILRKEYGKKQGKQFRIWLDNVLATQISSDIWLVKFDKWELHGMSLLYFLLFMFISFLLFYISRTCQLADEERHGCVVTTILRKVCVMHKYFYGVNKLIGSQNC